jgi:hypothetical protein
MATAIYEIYVCQEWARANDLTGTIKLSEYLVGTTTDRTLVDSGEGTYVWDHSQDACPDTLVSLYRGRIKVLTTRRLPSQMAQPSWPGETRTRSLVWS